jgi:hypothetical protein
MHRSIHSADGETEVLAGSPASPSGPPLGPTVIPFPLPCRTAALAWEEEAGELDEDVFDLGSLAVRLVGNFSKPRLLVFAQAPGWEEEEPGACY